ncbi:GNAT family N-acetyltransferase [Labilibaculum euxinus]
MYEFKLISLSELEKIKCCSKFPSCQFKWIVTWFSVFKNVENNVFGYRKKPYIIGAYLEETLIAIIPMMKLSRFFCKIRFDFLEFLGQQWCSMGNDIIDLGSLDDNFSEELIFWIKKNIHFHFLFLRYLPKTSVLNKKFRMFHYAGAPFIRVSDYHNYEEFSSQVYTGRFQSDLRKKSRKIKKDGFESEISFNTINEESLSEIRRIAKTKKIDGKSFLYADMKKEAFQLQMYQLFPSQVVFLKLNKQAVAYGTYIDWNGERIGIDAAFDRDYRKYGAGIHCIDALIQHSFSEKKQKISFGMGLDSYKFQFTDQIDRYFMCYDYKLHLKSLLALPYFLYRLKKEDQMVAEKLLLAEGK